MLLTYLKIDRLVTLMVTMNQRLVQSKINGRYLLNTPVGTLACDSKSLMLNLKKRITNKKWRDGLYICLKCKWEDMHHAEYNNDKAKCIMYGRQLVGIWFWSAPAHFLCLKWWNVKVVVTGPVPFYSEPSDPKFWEDGPHHWHVMPKLVGHEENQIHTSKFFQKFWFGLL